MGLIPQGSLDEDISSSNWLVELPKSVSTRLGILLSRWGEGASENMGPGTLKWRIPVKEVA